ncbi:hypothetical protein MBLNU230_g8235t1 [Neophaeotheca triangularis]
MSATQRLPVIAGTLSLGALIATATSSSALRQRLFKYLSPTARKTMWWLLGILFALVNFKNLPFLWHFRVFRGILYQLYFQTRPLPPSHLFAPIVTSSRNSLWDTDYNLHKSNSTYFADLDVSRAHAMGAIIRTGLQRLNSGDRVGLPAEAQQSGARPIPLGQKEGSFVIALGGVACHFHKQIELGQAFEIWTRVLSWDRKWLYMVSHIVRKGTVKPEKYVLQPWRRGGAPVAKTRTEAEGKNEEDPSKYIFATSIARYVVKKGRLTINPEVILERSLLLPTRPEGVGMPPRAEGSPSHAEAPTPADTPANGEALTSPETVATELSSRLAGPDMAARVPEGDAEWTWEDMEKERLRGLKFAQHFDGLAALQGEMKTGEALGRYHDFLW